MKNKKHQFVHPDPERKEPSHTIRKEKKTSDTKIEIPQELIAVKTDLQSSAIAIIIFAFILIGFYLIDLRYNLLDLIKEIF